MKLKQIFILLLSLGVILSGVSLASAASSWRNPTATPPNNNVEAPINVGSDAQDKSGVLRVTGFRSFFDAIFDTKLQVGTTSVMPANLTLLTHGNVGAAAYCDENGQNCVNSSGITYAGTQVTNNNNSGGSDSFAQYKQENGISSWPSYVGCFNKTSSPNQSYNLILSEVIGDRVWYQSSLANASFNKTTGRWNTNVQYYLGNPPATCPNLSLDGRVYESNH